MSPTTPSFETESITVLHVDDDQGFLDVATAMLDRKSERISVVAATSGSEGLSKLRAHSIDCIVSDYNMPHVDGLELLERVRREYPELPFILFTGRGSEEIASEAISHGVTDYLQKGTKTNTYTVLANRIEHAVSRFRSRKALQKREESHVRAQRIADLGNWDRDLERERLYWSDQVSRIFGVDEEFEPTYEAFLEYVHPEDRAAVRRTLDEALDSGDSYSIEHRIVRDDGAERIVHEEAEIVRNEEADPTAVRGTVQDITERVHRRRDLDAFREAVEKSGNSIYWTDADGTIQYVNSAFEGVTGYSAEEAIGETPRILKSGVHGESFYADLWATISAGRVWNDQVINERKDGERYVVEQTIAPVVDEGGAVERYIAVNADITDIKRRQQRIEALHEATRALIGAESRTEVAELTAEAARNALDYPCTAVWLLSDEGRLVPAAVTDEMNALVAGDPTSDAAGEASARYALANGETVVHEDVTQLEDGPDQSRIRGVMGVPIGDAGVVTVADSEPDAFDQSDISLAEILTAGADAAIGRIDRDHELERYETMANTAADMVYHLDLDGRFQFVNDAAETLTGYDRETLLGEHVSLIMSDDGIEAGLELISELLHDGAVSSDAFEWQLYPACGDPIPAESHITLLEEDGEFVGTVGVVRGIEERHEQERTLERQNRRLEEFGALVSHDLRNPLNVAQGRAELAREECSSDHLEYVVRAHDRMATLITDLLRLAQQGKDVDDTESVAIADAVERSWDTVDTASATLVVDTGRTVVADVGSLQQLLENILRNAVKHGGSDVTVTVGELPDGFYVADDGPGIPESEWDRAFETGYTTGGGTGLGLSIVRRIADAHGWDVSLAKSAAGGAQLEFRDSAVER